MASIEKRAGRPNPWQVRYRGPDGRQRSKQFKRRVDAERWLSETQQELYTGSWIDPRLSRIGFAEWADRWDASTVNLRPTTRARDASILARHVLPRFGALDLCAIEHMAVREWIAELSACGLAPATVHKCHQCLSKILAAAVDARMLHHNPADRVPLPRITQHEMRHLDPDELAALADAIHPRYRALVLVSGYCGLRIGEIAGLRRRRVDLLRRRIEVAEIAVEVRGHVQFGQPKTAAGHRTVPFPRFLTHELAEHLGRWPQPGSEGLVFTGPEGGVLRVPAFRRRMWLPAVERAGLAPLRIHDLRHTAVSLWIAAGVDVKTIAVRAGHTSVRTVLDRYGHLRDREDDPALDALDAMHASARPRMAEIVIELLG